MRASGRSTTLDQGKVICNGRIGDQILITPDKGVRALFTALASPYPHPQPSYPACSRAWLPSQCFLQDPRGLAPSPFSHCPRARASEPESERSRQVSAARSRRATHSGRLQPLPLGTRQTGFTCPRPEEVTNPSSDNRRKRASFPILFPTLPVASLCFYLTLTKPQKARTQPGSWSGMVSSAVSKTVQPKTQTPARDMF